MKINNLLFLILINISVIIVADDEIIKINPIKANMNIVEEKVLGYMPLFGVQPQYPRRMQERGMSGYVILKFSITEKGATNNIKVQEAMCGDYINPDAILTNCSSFNKSALNAGKKLKYKPRIDNGKPVKVDGVLYRFSYYME